MRVQGGDFVAAELERLKKRKIETGKRRDDIVAHSAFELRTVRERFGNLSILLRDIEVPQMR